jgi:hypothetical protein
VQEASATVQEASAPGSCFYVTGEAFGVKKKGACAGPTYGMSARALALVITSGP